MEFWPNKCLLDKGKAGGADSSPSRAGPSWANARKKCTSFLPKESVVVFVPVKPKLGNFRLEYDYEYEFSVLSTRTFKNVVLET